MFGLIGRRNVLANAPSGAWDRQLGGEPVEFSLRVV